MAAPRPRLTPAPEDGAAPDARAAAPRPDATAPRTAATAPEPDAAAPRTAAPGTAAPGTAAPGTAAPGTAAPGAADRRPPGPLSHRDPHVAAVRTAVRAFLAAAGGHLDTGEITVAVSGGADSLALAALTVPLAHQHDRTVRAVIVDHGLQPDSATVAATAAAQADRLGADAVEVRTVTVDGAGGPEAAARTARYAALRAAAPRGLVLLAHTRDDQAETVLLGLGRGSGARSLAGMRPLDPPWGRPLLDVTRADTAGTCAALGITPWQDPHNADPRFTRSRLRHDVLPLLDDVLGGGVGAALARTARQLREDTDALDALAATHPVHPLSDLRALPAALRRRVLRRWLRDGGVPGLTEAHLRAVDELVTDWRGQGPCWLPGAFTVTRRDGRLDLEPR